MNRPHYIKKDTNTRPVPFVQIVSVMVLIFGALCALHYFGVIGVCKEQFETIKTR